MEHFAYTLAPKELEQISILAVMDEAWHHVGPPAYQCTFLDTHQVEHQPWYTQTRNIAINSAHSGIL
mgnify:CR=1 FL=1